MSLSLLLPFIAALLPLGALGHGGVWNYSIAGEWRPGFFPYSPVEGQSSIQRHWADFRPIYDVNTPMLTCNDPGTYAEEYATVNAGSEIGAYWRGWPHDIGPVIVWMAYCGAEPTSCSSFNGSYGKHWFKISQAGLLSGTIQEGLWAQKHINLNRNYTWSVTIPETLKGGAYLLRHELIALHVPLEPEFYPQCAHLFVTGGGDETPGEEYLAEIPGVWTDDEPDLHINVYREPTASRTDWEIPGPPVWTGNGQ